MSAPMPSNEGWWDPKKADKDVIAHTPDPTKYHYPDGRQNERLGSGVKGVIIPRATKHGGSMGFNANMAGVVHVDPEAPDGGAIVDLSAIDPRAIERATKMAEHPHEAFYRINQQQKTSAAHPVHQPEIPTHPEPPSQVQNVHGVPEQNYSQAIPPSLPVQAAAAQPMVYSAAIPPSPEIASLGAGNVKAAASQPAPQPAPQPVPHYVENPSLIQPAEDTRIIHLEQTVKNLVGMFQSFMSTFSAEKAVEPQSTYEDVPLPPVTPQPNQTLHREPPNPQRVPVPARGPVSEVTQQQLDALESGNTEEANLVEKTTFGQLGISWLGPEPVKPQHQVKFLLPSGTFSVYYHDIIVNDLTLALVTDGRYAGNQRFTPVEDPKKKFEVQVPSLGESYTCAYGGQNFTNGCLEYEILVIELPAAPEPAMMQQPNEEFYPDFSP